MTKRGKDANFFIRIPYFWKMQFIDQLNRSIQLHKTPQRIVSLVPSQSEFLWHIGLRNELVGITKFCIKPQDMYKSVAHVGGTKTLNLEKIRALKPDLIIGNKEENEQSQIDILQKEFPLWLSDIYTFEDAFNMMLSLGKLTNREETAQHTVNEIKPSLQNIKNIFSKQAVAYFIWNKPYMCAAKNTFIDFVLNYLGFENVLQNYSRYPELSDEDLKRLNPEICFLSSEPFPFKEQHIKTLQQKLPHSKILMVDGELFSWYGSRLLYLEKYVNELKHQLS